MISGISSLSLNGRRRLDIGLMLAHRLRRWLNIKPSRVCWVGSIILMTFSTNPKHRILVREYGSWIAGTALLLGQVALVCSGSTHMSAQLTSIT